MKTITKSQVAELIEVLADRTLSFGCMLEHPEYNENGYWIIVCVRDGYYCTEQPKTGANVSFSEYTFKKGAKILGHHITIGRVLELIKKANIGGEFNNPTTEPWYYQELINLWEPCDFKPLQELIEESGWEECKRCKGKGLAYASFDPNPMNCPDCKGGKKRLKSPQVNDLCVFLYQLFIKK